MLKEVEPKEALHDALEGKLVYQIYYDTVGAPVIEDLADEIEQILGRTGSRFLADDKKSEDTPEKEPAKKKGPKEKKIDEGKIKALHDAGWTNTAIADEMGVSAPTVAKYIVKAMEEEEPA